MTTPHDRWTDDIAIWDAELDRVLGGAMPSADAPAWCTDVAVLVRTAQAPAQPDEMRREHDIIARMTGLRLAVLAGDEPEGDVAGFPVVDVPDRPALVLAPAHPVDTADIADAVVPPPAEVDLRTPPAVIDELAARRAEEEAYTAKHSGERGYTAKHAARLEASRHPAARTLGRVLAIKAVAITTAAVVGVAAAAATTGIMATVVVPAINDSTRRPITPAPATTTDHGDNDEGSGGSGSFRGAGGAAEDCEATVTCSPDTTASTLPPASTATTVPAGAGTTVPGRPATPSESTTTSTTDPSTATTVDPPPDTTTTTSTTVQDPAGPTTLGAT
jgi:hypothetical protein